MQITVNDRASYRITRREYTDEGFLRVPGKVARIGIQDYLARELGLPGDPNRIVKVYRPAEEVFNDESLASYDTADVTIEHPKGFVTADNYRSVSAGFVRGAARQDGDYVVADLIIKDKRAIDAINSGKVELSAGYTAVYDERPGVSPEGEPYDMVQTQIRINHVAIVDRARAGAGARIFDRKNEGKTMHRINLDSGRSVEVSDEATALLVSDSLERLTKQVTDAEAARDAAQATADAHAEEIAALKKTIADADAALGERLAAVVRVQADAARIAGEGFTCDSVDITEIQRAALSKLRPAVEWADKSATYVQAAFDMAKEAMEEEEENEDAGGRGKKRGEDAGGRGRTRDADYSQLAQDGAAGVQDSAPKKPVLSRAQEALLKATGKGV